jgi:transketolase
MPSWELFDAQDDEYREEVLPPELPSVSIEAGISMGWSKYVDASVSIERFGASAPGEVVLEKLGITPDHAADKVRELLAVAA